MRFLSADLIFPVTASPVHNGIIITENDGTVLDLIDPSINDAPHPEKIEKHTGIICPGFVNAHCHLELSHLKNKFTQKKGLPHFIEEVISQRNNEPGEIEAAAKQADEEMFKDGIVAVGDISNTADCLALKQLSRIYYHTFIEVYDNVPARTRVAFDSGLELQEKFHSVNLVSNLTPHAPYSVTPELMKLILNHTEKNTGIISIHNQETESENEMFMQGSGILLNKLRKLTGALADFKPTNNTSLATFAGMNKTTLPVQFVHNTFTSETDIDKTATYPGNIFWCLCLNANLFIEDRIPPVDMLLKKGCKLTMGTDSYASNTSLSILHELKTMTNYFPEISLELMIRAATLHGAEFLNIDHIYGSIEKGKRPGLILIDNLEIKTGALTVKSNSKRLV